MINISEILHNIFTQFKILFLKLIQIMEVFNLNFLVGKKLITEPEILIIFLKERFAWQERYFIG